MKNIKISVTLVFLFGLFGREGFSQTDEVRTYYPLGLSLNYSGAEMDNISELKFLSDSLMQLKIHLDPNSSEISVDRINSMSFKNGSYGWLGAGVGAGVGAIVGIAQIISASGINDDATRGLTTIGVSFIAFAEILAGALVGGLVGMNVGKYDSYYFDKAEKEKAKKIKNILKVQKVQLE